MGTVTNEPWFFNWIFIMILVYFDVAISFSIHFQRAGLRMFHFDVKVIWVSVFEDHICGNDTSMHIFPKGISGLSNANSFDQGFELSSPCLSPTLQYTSIRRCILYSSCSKKLVLATRVQIFNEAGSTLLLANILGKDMNSCLLSRVK